MTYEAFGAVGDGVADDFEAIRQAHAHANARGLAVRSNPSGVYYIGPARAEAVIMTDTDWSTSRFILDDADILPEDRHWHVFRVSSAHPPVALAAPSIARGQARLAGGRLPANALVVAENAGCLQFKRLGLNQSDGEVQTDCFVVDQSGAILTPPAWDFDAVTRLTAYPMDARPLRIHGGIFETIANQAPSQYTYYGRGILCNRSNVLFDRLCHTVQGEGDHGAPYHGFARTEDCAYVTYRDCHFCGTKSTKPSARPGSPC